MPLEAYLPKAELDLKKKLLPSLMRSDASLVAAHPPFYCNLAASILASNSEKSAWMPTSGGAMGSTRKAAISQSVSSRTMSAADRQRSWRSANENSSRDHGRSSGPSGGPKARKKDAGLARKMQTRSKVSSRDREAISPQSRGIGPQPRANGGEWGAQAENGAQSAKAHQTHMIGGD